MRVGVAGLRELTFQRVLHTEHLRTNGTWISDDGNLKLVQRSRGAIPGEELLRRSSDRCSGEWDMRGKNYLKRVDSIFQTTKSSREILTELSSISPRFWGVEFRAEPSPNNVR